MRLAFAFAIVAALAACGVDGPPEPPQAGLHGEISVGIGGSL